MATNPEHPQGEPASEDHHFDDKTGVYGFFRRHQKKLLYSAGFFTLLTFSITGPLTSFVGDVFGTQREMPSIVVNGSRVKLTSEDFTYGNLIARNQIYGLPAGVMLPIAPGEGGESELAETMAIIRRVAIEEGIGVSYAEVDRAIEAERERAKAESAAKLAQARGFQSLAQFRTLVGEAMRIGTYTRLQLLALDSSDAEVMDQVVRDREKITLKVATFDEKARQEELTAASELTDDDLRKWLEEKDDREKQRMNAYDLPIVQLRFAALLLAEGQFDPSQWQEGLLADFEVNDEQLKSYYEQEKELRFKAEAPDEFKPFDDEAVKAELTRLVQAERVMNDLLGKVRQQQLDALKPMNEELARVQSELQEARQAEQTARQEQLTKEKELVAKQAELEQKPDDEALKAAVTELEAAVQAAKDAVFAAEPVVPAKQAALEAAEAAIDESRANFDFAAAMTTLTTGKTGFVQKAMTEMKNGEALKDLDELGLELGEWPMASSATGLQNAGDLGFGPGRTSTAIVIYQAIAAEPKPLKAWEELKPLVQEAHWAEKAAAEGREKRQQMTDALLRLAKEQMPEFVSEREGDRENRITAKLTEWEDAVKADIERAEQTLAQPKLGTQARTAWQRKLDTKTAELAGKDNKRTQIEFQVDRDTKSEIAEEAKKHYGKVLDAAAQEVGFQVESFGPYVRDLQQQPRFKDKYDPTVVYLWTNHSELEVDEAVDIVQDMTERRLHVAACTKVEPVTPDDVTRREFETRRQGFGLSFARIQTYQAMQHVFTKEALSARYQFEREVGRQTEPVVESQTGKAETGNPETGNPETGNPETGNPESGNPGSGK